MRRRAIAIGKVKVRHGSKARAKLQLKQNQATHGESNQHPSLSGTCNLCVVWHSARRYASDSHAQEADAEILIIATKAQLPTVLLMTKARGALPKMAMTVSPKPMMLVLMRTTQPCPRTLGDHSTLKIRRVLKSKRTRKNKSRNKLVTRTS